MIILVAVTINVAINGGLFETAKKAQKDYTLEQLKEAVSLILAQRKMTKEAGGELGDLKTDLESIEGAIVEELEDGIYYVTKDGNTVTVYEDGDMLTGKVDVWDGATIELPEIKEFNWYIYTGGQLKFLADFVNNNNALTEEQKALVAEKGYNENEITMTEEVMVYLMNSLDLGARQEEGEITTGKSWTPIGDATKFLGTFEGNNNIIKGVYVKKSGNYAGIFGTANSIQNLTIKDSFIQGDSRVGGISGDVTNIIGCHNDNTVVKIPERGKLYCWRCCWDC